MTISELRRRFESGALSRDDFWLAAQREYRRLRENSPLPPGGVVRAIHSEGGELVMELRDGLRMQWDPDDLRTAPNMLLNHAAYEERELEVLLDAAATARVVFDVGANVGWYTLHFARHIGPEGGHVYALEPIPRTFASLRRNVALNDLAQFTTLLPVGLGQSDGKVEFFLPGVTGSVAASQRPLFENEPNEKIRTRIVRLDDVVAEFAVQRLDLLKSDIEGAELFMLRGGIETIRRFRPVLFLELLRKWSRAYGYHPNDVIALLESEGYDCFAITGASLERMTRMDNDCASTNFLFRPRGLS